MHEMLPEWVRDLHDAGVHTVALNGSDLWWDPRDIGKREDLQPLLIRQAIATLGSNFTTTMGALM